MGIWGCRLGVWAGGRVDVVVGRGTAEVKRGSVQRKKREQTEWLKRVYPPYGPDNSRGAGGRGDTLSSHTMCRLNDFVMSTSPKNRRLMVLISNDKQ